MQVFDILDVDPESYFFLYFKDFFVGFAKLKLDLISN